MDTLLTTIDAPDLISYAIPVWLFLITMEFIYVRWRKQDYCRLNDTLNSLSLGNMFATSNAITKVIGVASYVYIQLDFLRSNGFAGGFSFDVCSGRHPGFNLPVLDS